MSLTSTELNYLIWRYLQESGLDLPAYALDKHTNCANYEETNTQLVSRIQPGCLVELVQKGILFSLAQQEVSGKDDRLTLFGSLVQDELDKRKLNGKTHLDDTTNRFQLKDVEVKEEIVSEKNEDVDVDVDVNDNDKVNDIAKLSFTTKVVKASLSFEDSLCCDWHPSIDVFAYGKQDSKAVINAILQGKISESVTLNHVANEISLISFSPHGNLIVTASTGELRAWSPDGKLINIAKYEGGPIIKLLWSDNHFLLSIDSAMQVSLWDGATLNPIKQISPPIESPENFIIDACWLGDSKFAVSTLRNSIKVYSITPFGSSYDLQSIGYLPGHDHNISLLVLDQRSRLLASSSDYDYKIKIWTNGLAQDCLTLNGVVADNSVKVHASLIKLHTSPIISMYWLHHQNDSFLLSLSMEGVVNIWNGKLGQNILSLEIFKQEADFKLPENSKHQGSLIFNSTVSPNNKVLAIGNDFGGVSFWDIDLESYDLHQQNQILRCLAVYDPELVQDNTKTNVGICDLKWDSKSLKVCVSYRGINSVVIDWD